MRRFVPTELKSCVFLAIVSILLILLSFQVHPTIRVDLADEIDSYATGFSTVERNQGHSFRWSSLDSTLTLYDFGRQGPIMIQIESYVWRDPTQVYSATVAVNGHAVGNIDRAGWRSWQFEVTDPRALNSDDLTISFHSLTAVPPDYGSMKRGIGVASVTIRSLGQRPTSLWGLQSQLAIPSHRQLLVLTLIITGLYLFARLIGLPERWALILGIGAALSTAAGMVVFRAELELHLARAVVLAAGLVIVVTLIQAALEYSRRRHAVDDIAGGAVTRRSGFLGALDRLMHRTATRAAVTRESAAPATNSRGTASALGRVGKDRWNIRWLALVYVILFMIIGIATLPDYGISWDEGLGHMFFGERYLHYFMTFDAAYLDFNNPQLDIHSRPLNLFQSPFHIPAFAREVLPLADVLSAATMEILSYGLGWMDPVDAFHVAKVLLSGALLWVLFRFLFSRLGPWVAFLTIFFLSTFPRFWGDMHFNPLDIAETVFFSMTLMAFAVWFERPSWQRALLTGALAGCALSTKGNALFLPVVLVVGVWPWQWTRHPWEQVVRHVRTYYRHYAWMVTTALGIHIASWPYVYANPLRIFDYYQYISSQGARTGGGWNPDPLIQALTTMPESMLALLAIGIIVALTRLGTREGATLRLALAWVTIPILRTSLPNMVNFDGIRHYEEFVPAACILAAYGGVKIVELVSRGDATRRRIWNAALVLAIIANLALVTVRFHPYEYIYYNSIVQGLSGANRRYGFADATDYWGVSYRSGMRWLNANAAPNAVIHTGVAEWLVNVPAKNWLRSDMAAIPEADVKLALAQGRPVYVMFATRYGWQSKTADACIQNLTPVHQIFVDTVPILNIYRLPENIPLP